MSDYNGYTNYATWRVQLEFFDGDDFERWHDFVRDHKGDYLSYDIGQWMSNEVDERMDCNDDTVSSYARAFLADVNWQELSKHAIEVIQEELDKQKEEDDEH